MSRNDGLTLLEVLIALIILAIGILAAASMQTTALSTTSRATISQQLTKLASAEIEMQRQLATPTNKPTCLSGSTTGYACTTTVLPCSVSGTSITCSSRTTAVAAYRTTVVVSGPRNSTFTLSTLIPFGTS